MENLKWQVPLWKMRITNDQYTELKKELYDAFYSNDPRVKQRLKKEAALYYAEWWRREYNGGTSSKEALTKTLEISSEYSEELYKLAKAGAKRLDVPVIVRQNRLWFRSILIQGGLPMHHIHNNKENIIGYKNFLIGLVRHTKSISIDWNDISFVENLSCTNHLPASFKNEGIFELSLLIARAINEENDELLPYDTTEGNWNDLTNDLKVSSRAEFSKAVPFILYWRIIKTSSHIKLTYKVEVAKKISDSYIQEHKLADCYSFSLYVQSQYLATYIRSVNNDFLCREKNSLNFIWKEEPVISLQLKTDSNQIIDITAPNSFAPDLGNPLLLVESDGYWNIKTVTSNTNKNAVLFTKEWHNSHEAEDVQIGTNNLKWTEFDENITLRNSDTDDEITFDNTSSHYSCEFAGWSIDWVQDANYKILAIEPDIRLYDEFQERVKTGNIFYRESHGREWKKYQRGTLPIGLVEFKVEQSENKYLKEKFFYTGSLNCLFENMTQNSGIITWEWDGGSIFPVTEQDGLEIEKLRDKSWRITRKNNQSQYPETTKFRLFQKLNGANSPFLEIAVASPFKGVVLLNSNGNEIKKGQVLCRTSLYGYRYIVMGQNVPTQVFHIQNDKVVITGQLSQGIQPLSRFEDNIRDIFLLNGSDTFDYDSKVRVIIGRGGNNTLIEVKEYNVFLKKKADQDSILIIDNPDDQNIINYQGELYALTVDCSYEDIKVERLVKKDDGFYIRDNVELKQFIVFSDKFTDRFTDDQVVPRFFDFSHQTVEVQNSDNSGLSPQENNIKNIKAALEEAQPFTEEWKRVIGYYNIVMKYSLPFKTLNCFRAIAKSPELLTKMALTLSQSSSITKDDFHTGLSRFEGEFAIAWHWISNEYWDNASGWFLQDFSELVIQNLIKSLFESRKSLLLYTLNTVPEDAINILINNVRNHIPVQAPTRNQINDIRAKLGANKNFPDNLIFIPDIWKHLFPNALDGQLPIHVRALLISPVKAALTLTGKDNSLWEDKNLKIRRTINFYRQFLPAEYAEILLCMAKRINQK